MKNYALKSIKKQSKTIIGNKAKESFKSIYAHYMHIRCIWSAYYG